MDYKTALRAALFVAFYRKPKSLVEFKVHFVVCTEYKNYKNYKNYKSWTS